MVVNPGVGTMDAGHRTDRERGLTIVFTGEGKGKTSAALGIALRASGYGMRTCIIQFIKGGTESGESEAIRKLPTVELHGMGKGFVFEETGREFDVHRRSAQAGLRLAEERMASRAVDILVLDEINNATRLGLIDTGQLLDLIDRKPPTLHLILTGRDADPAVLEKADTVTEMKPIRHAYREGIKAVKGIDY
jgi:cob(I)alamin adenosyltransferase